jgi:hypothetical protein
MGAAELGYKAWKRYGIECDDLGRYCVQLRPTCSDVLVLCAVDALLT